MKRIFTLTMILLTLTSASFAKVRFGLEGGAYINKLKFDKSIADTENRAGFFVGGKLKASLPLGFGVDGALLYSNRSFAFENDYQKNGVVYTEENSKTLNYITVPVNVRWQLGSDKFAPYIATGPQWDFFIGDSKLYTSEGLRATFEHNIISWNIGVGLMLLDHVQLGFSWNFPITKSATIKDVYDEVKGQVVDSSAMKNKEWTIRVNYYF